MLNVGCWMFSLHATPVMFPLNQMFGTNVYAKNFTLQAAQSWVTDGTNAWIGTDVTVTPAGGTNPVVQLTPNTYLVTFPDATYPWRIAVPNTTNLLNAVDLGTGPLPTFLVQPVTPLAGGAGVVITNLGGTNFAAIDPNLVLTNTQTGVTLTGNFTATGGNVVTNNSSGNSLSGSFTGDGSGLTNVPGAKDPLALSYLASNNVADPESLDRLDKYLRRARTAQSFPHMRAKALFNPAYGSSTNGDLFGNKIIWRNDSIYGPPTYTWGANLSLTNQGTLALPTPNSTNWTIMVTKHAYRANQAGALTGISFPWCNEFALENTNGDSFNFIFATDTRAGYQFVPTYGGALGMGSNVSWSFLFRQGSAGAAQVPEASPLILTFEANGGSVVFGNVDTLPIWSPISGSSNLMVNSHNFVTNLSPVAQITIGGSTNWNKIFYENASSSDKPTNGLCEEFDVTYWDTAISSNDVNIYYSAEYELFTTKRQWIILGDSMMAGDNNYILPFNTGYGSMTNFTLFYFMQKYPQDMWHDWAQGGSTLSSFTNSLPTRLITLMPSDCDVTIIEDFPRNDALTTNSISIPSLTSNLNFALSPWIANGAHLWQYESPLPATNVPAAIFVTNTVLGQIMRSNLINAYYAQHTNPIFSRYLDTIAYFNGPVWDTNNGWSGYGAIGFAFENPGYHVENTNSPLFHAKDAVYWQTGMWPDNPPAVQAQ